MTFPGRMFRPRLQFDEAHLSGLVIQNLPKSFVNEIELLLVEPKRDGKFQALTVLVGNERFMNSSIIIQVRALPVNRLLEIADHAEVAGPRTQMSILQPKAPRFRRARRFQQHGKLQRLSVLRLVENDTKVFFANPLRGDRMLQQLFRERDLISVGDESVVESKIEIITLHLRRDAGRRIAYPFSQRRKFRLPQLCEHGVCRRETNRPAQSTPNRRRDASPIRAIRPAIC